MRLLWRELKFPCKLFAFSCGEKLYWRGFVVEAGACAHILVAHMLGERDLVLTLVMRRVCDRDERVCSLRWHVGSNCFLNHIN